MVTWSTTDSWSTDRMSKRYEWQDSFLKRYVALEEDNFMLVAAPGAGKTLATMKLARALMDVGLIDYVVVVAPTRRVQKQWERVARSLKIDLDSGFANRDGAPQADFDGIVVTYQSVGSQPQLYRTLVSRHRTLVVLDEAHHMEEKSGWGQACLEAFEPASRRLLLSGTPFRTKGFIPFVEYDPDGFVTAHYTFGYSRAVNAWCCRPLYVAKIGGKVEWEWRGEHREGWFADEQDDERANQELRAALDPGNPILRRMLEEGETRLKETRAEGITNAGGLVLCMDKSHAYEVADLMYEVTGRRPVVVVTDTPNALAEIDRFANGTDKWMVAVRMVSEGVDIPRLRVLVYATNYTSEMFFRQAAGRVCRGDGDAYMIISNNPKLRGYAERMMDERTEGLEAREAAGPGGDSPPNDRDYDDPGFRSIDGDAEFVGASGVGGSVESDAFDDARIRLKQAFPDLDPPFKLLYDVAVWQKRAEGTAPPEDQTTKAERKEELRKLQNSLVRRFCMTTGADFKEVNNDLNRRVGIRRLRDATEEQLVQRLELARQLCVA